MVVLETPFFQGLPRLTPSVALAIFRRPKIWVLILTGNILLGWCPINGSDGLGIGCVAGSFSLGRLAEIEKVCFMAALLGAGLVL
jgi:hypothetical protein